MLREEPTNRVIDSRRACDCHRQLRERSLNNVAVTLFEPGQLVVWTYRPQLPSRQTYLVEAEVVQPGPLRARIRLRDTEGHILLRWVKPERLRRKQVNEAIQLYPAHRASR